MRRFQFRSSLRCTLVAAGLTLLASGGANAQWSNASVFTEDGVELGVEPRIFALFALMNSVGYDKETVLGPQPLERPLFSAAREKLRQNLGRSTSKDLAELFRTPGSVKTYVDAVLELGPAPRFTVSETASPLARSLAGPLREWFNEEGGAALLRNANEDARATQTRLLPALAQAVGDVTKTVRLGDASDQLLDGGASQGRVAVVLNDLDAHGVLFSVVAADTTGIISGPSRGDGDDVRIVDAATLAYARTVVAGEAEKLATAGTLAEGHPRLLASTKEHFATEKAYARELLACAVARQVRARPVACPTLEEDPEASAALALMAPRVAAYASTQALLSAAITELLALPAPPPPPVVEEPVEDPKKTKKDKKKGKG
jgi:hypothetical protein